MRWHGTRSSLLHNFTYIVLQCGAMHTNLPRVIKHRALIAGPITSAPRPLGHSQICPRFPRKPVSQHFRSILSFPSEQCIVLDFPRPRSGRGVSWCGGMRAARGADGTSAAMYRPARPESEASACRARRTGLQSTGASCAVDFTSTDWETGFLGNQVGKPIEQGNQFPRKPGWETYRAGKPVS